jgi:hypothetical protein
MEYPLSRPSKQLEDYKKLGEEKNLRFLGEEAPSTTTETTLWMCLNCGRELSKCYNKLKYSTNSCRCRSKLTLKKIDYRNLAERLGIIWVYNGENQFFPKTNKEKALWKTKAGTKFFASYHELAYQNMPFRLREIIEDQ